MENQSNLSTDYSNLLTDRRINKQINNKEINYSHASKVLVKDAFFSVLSLIFIFINETVIFVFIGYYDFNYLAAIGIGTVFINFSGFVLGLGLIGGIDTICSQSFGALDFKMVGIYTNIARIFVFLFFVVFVCPMMFFSKIILLKIGQINELAEYGSIYCLYMLPSILFALQYNVNIRYLQSMGIYKPSFYISIITSLLHPLWCLIFIYYFQLGLEGAGLAMSMSQLLNYILVYLYIQYYNPYPDSNIELSKEILDYNLFVFYLKIAIPSAIVSSAEWLGFEILTLISSYLGTTSLAANVCFFNFLLLIFTIPEGIGISCSTHVGNSIGSRDIKSAKIFAKAGIISGLGIMAVVSIIIYMYRNIIPELYTSDYEIIYMMGELFSIYACFSLIDSAQHIILGIIKGLGLQYISSIFCVIVLYPINIPLSYYLAFTCEMGLKGLWYSQLISISLLCLCYIVIIFRSDWINISLDNYDHIEQIDQ